MYFVGNYGVKHYTADSYNDVALIPLADIMPGSTVFVIDTSTYYMLNSEKKWITVNLAASGGAVPAGIVYEGGGV